MATDQPVWCGICDAHGTFTVEYDRDSVTLFPATGWRHSDNCEWICPECVKSVLDAVVAGKIACVGDEPILMAGVEYGIA